MKRETENLTTLVKHGAISRRDFFRRAALLGISAGTAASILAACSPAAPAPAATQAPAGGATPAAGATSAPAATPAAAAIKRGGTVTHSINWTLPTMDPHLTTIREHALYENMFEGLVAFERADETSFEHKVVGVLAESWEQPDAKTLVFKLRQGVKFHDGTDFDADVAAWNFLRCRDHEKSQVKVNLATIDTVTALDKNTLEIKTKSDNAALLRVLAYTTSGMVRMISKDAFDKNGEEWMQRNAVGTGAFKFKEWITDDRVILEKNPTYWGKGEDGQPLPYLDGLIIRYIPDPTVALTDMRAGTLQLLEWVPPKDVETIKADPNLDMMELPWAGQIYFMVGYNAAEGPFADLKVRQAANYGIDRVAMHQALGFGVGAPHYYPYSMDGTLGQDDSIMKYEYDPAKVKQLLTEAGYPDGVDVELKVIAREPENTIGEYVQQMWTAVGIRTKLVAQERLSWIDAVRAGNFESCFWRGNLASVVDPELSRTLITCDGPSNWQAMCDPEIDNPMNEGLATLDEAERAAIYKKVWVRIQEQAYAGSGFIAPMVEGYNKNLHGLQFNYQVPNLRASWLG